MHPSREAQHLQISMSSTSPSSLQVFKTRPTSMDFTHWHQGFDTFQLWTVLSSIAVLLLAPAALGIPLAQTVKHARSVGVESYYPDSVYEVLIDHKHSKIHLMLLLDVRRRDPHALWRARPGVPYDGILCFMGLYQRTSPPLPPSSLLMFYSRDGTEH